MTINLESLSHSAAYEQLAQETHLSPEEIAHTANFFGNDFDSLQAALIDPNLIGDFDDQYS